jgi:hypothetical protein
MNKAKKFFKVGKNSLKDFNKFIDEHEFVYRFLPMEFLLDTIHNNRMIFTNPSKWNDPFDNFLFKISDIDPKKSFTSSLFCQCLTTNHHSEAYWKTYGGSGFAARLKINTSEYLNFIEGRENQFWIGKMEYLNETKLIENIKAIQNLKSDLSKSNVSNSFLEAFFYKRKPFEYENEVRLLIKSKPTKNGLKRIKIKDHSFIKEIKLDPRMGKNEETAWKEHLKKRNFEVTKSHLFKEKKII